MKRNQSRALAQLLLFVHSLMVKILTKAMDGRIVRCGIISSCQSAATSEIVKRFWSRFCLMQKAL